MSAAMEIPGLELEEELGRGSHSVVYRARYEDRRCAVKIARRRQRSTRWFRREAIALARVLHPGVPRVLSVGEVDDRSYLVMELVQGETLATRLNRKALTTEETIDLGTELAAILKAVHARGLVHRDIKPHNIIIEEAGRVRLVDFGLVTQTRPPVGLADAAGTLKYAAPEQMRAPHVVDARADLYALGQVLLECVEGGECEGEGALRRIIDHLLMDDPADRYASAAALAQDLERVGRKDDPVGPAGIREIFEPRGRIEFVARDAELSGLRAAWDQIVTGRGRVALVEGAPGSGKTRLLAEVRGSFMAEGALCLRTAGRSSQPLAALGTLVDGYLDTLDAVDDLRRHRAVEKVRSAAAGPAAPLLASLSRRLAAVLGVTPVGAREDNDAFVEATAAFLSRVAELSGPTFVEVDDLQWIDPVSCEVLVRVALGAPRLPMMFVAATRAEASEQPPVQRFVRAFDHERIDVVKLPHFEEPDVRSLLTAYFGARMDPALVHRVASLGDGTPLGALEIVGALVDEGALAPHWGQWRFDDDLAREIPLPRSSTGLLERRLETLAPATIRILQAVVLIGSLYDSRRVAQAVETSVDAVEVALADAKTAGLLELDRRGQPVFIHDTVREALASKLAPEQRRDLHRSLAEALDRPDPLDDDTLFAVAEHYARSGPRARASRVYQVSRAAAERAGERFDHETALRFFTVAREAAQACDEALDLDFHSHLAESQIRVGAFADSLASLDAAHALAEGMDRIRILARMAWVGRSEGDANRAWEALSRAFDLMRVPMPTVTPRSVLGVGLWAAQSRLKRGSHIDASERQRLELFCELHYLNLRLGVEYNKPLPALQSAVQLLGAARRLGPSPTLALAEASYGIFMNVLGRKRIGARHLNRAQALGRTLAEPAAVALTTQFVFTGFGWSDDFDRALALAQQCLDDYGYWLEVTEYCLAASSARVIESLRGNHRGALGWVVGAVRRVQRHARLTPAFHQLIVPSVLAELVALGRESDLRTIVGDKGLVTKPEDTQGFYRISAWGPAVTRYAGGATVDNDFEALVNAFEAEGHDPRRAHRSLIEYYIGVAHVRAQQCMDALQRGVAAPIALFDRALDDLRKAARISLGVAHLRVLEGYRAFLDGELGRARRKAAQGQELGEQENAPWVLYHVARLQAYVLRREGREAAALDKARVAAVLAEEYGAVHRLRLIRGEFGVEARPRARIDSATFTSQASSHRRQLRSLTEAVRAASRAGDIETRAKAVLDELIRVAEAEHALLLFDRSDVARGSMRIGRTRTGADWDPGDGHTALLEHVRGRDDIVTSADAVAAADARIPVEGRPMVVVPLHLHEQPVGALYLARAGNGPPFSHEEIELATALAAQVPLALELTRVLEEREALQASLRQAQKMEAVGRLAAGVAHDFNNMLSAVYAGLADLEDERERLGATGRQAVDEIVGASRRAAKLTRQLLAFSRRQELKLSAVDAKQVVREMVPMVRKLIGPRIDIEVRCGDGPMWVETDRGSLEQALVNLVANARDAMSDGGTVTIGVDEVALDETWVARGAQRTGMHVRIAVTDTGCGIEPGVLDNIFEPFFTTKRKGEGTGLGLTSVYGFVNQCAGCIDVRSEVGQGSTFAIYLPADGATPDPEPAQEPT